MLQTSTVSFNDSTFASDGILGTGRGFALDQRTLTVPEATLSLELSVGVTSYRPGRVKNGDK